MSAIKLSTALITRIVRLERIEAEHEAPQTQIILPPTLRPGSVYELVGTRGKGEGVRRRYRIPRHADTEAWLVEIGKFYCDCWWIAIMPVDLDELGEVPESDDEWLG